MLIVICMNSDSALSFSCLPTMSLCLLYLNLSSLMVPCTAAFNTVLSKRLTTNVRTGKHLAIKILYKIQAAHDRCIQEIKFSHYKTHCRKGPGFF